MLEAESIKKLNILYDCTISWPSVCKNTITALLFKFSTLLPSRVLSPSLYEYIFVPYLWAFIWGGIYLCYKWERNRVLGDRKNVFKILWSTTVEQWGRKKCLKCIPFVNNVCSINMCSIFVIHKEVNLCLTENYSGPLRISYKQFLV